MRQIRVGCGAPKIHFFKAALNSCVFCKCGNKLMKFMHSALMSFSCATNLTSFYIQWRHSILRMRRLPKALISIFLAWFKSDFDRIFFHNHEHVGCNLYQYCFLWFNVLSSCTALSKLSRLEWNRAIGTFHAKFKRRDFCGPLLNSHLGTWILGEHFCFREVSVTGLKVP